MIAIGTAIVGVSALTAYALYEKYGSKRGSRLPLPPPLEGGGGGGPGGLDPAKYPDFQGQSPGPQTPPGIYIIDDCTNFVFVPGDNGAQPLALDSIIKSAIDSSEIEGWISVDDEVPINPVSMATSFLSGFWPECRWPPSKDAAPRIVQLFMKLSHLIGRQIVIGGGRALGTSDPAAIDELVDEQLKKRGLQIYKPQLVPEIKLPALPGGIVIDEDYEGPQGGIQLPNFPWPGGGGGGGGGGQPQPQPSDCMDTPLVSSRFVAIPPSRWTQRTTTSIKLLTPPSKQCDEYEVRFGICVGADWSSFGVLDAYVGPNPPADIGEISFKIRNSDALQPIDYQQWQGFRRPLWWKAQYKLKIRYVNGKVTIVNPGAPLLTMNSEDMDACPNKEARWPESPTFIYYVTGTDDDDRMWNPMPRIKRVRASGNSLYVEIEYSGMPYFERNGDEAKARLAKDGGMMCYVKVWALGTSQA